MKQRLVTISTKVLKSTFVVEIYELFETAYISNEELGWEWERTLTLISVGDLDMCMLSYIVDKTTLNFTSKNTV